MSTQPPANGNSYTAAAAALSIALDQQMSEIRHAQDRRELSTREAADARIQALETHLESMRQLRHEHFGGNDDE